eukprot:3890996-Pyramimonas_sp.AAC.1
MRKGKARRLSHSASNLSAASSGGGNHGVHGDHGSGMERIQRTIGHLKEQLRSARGKVGLKLCHLSRIPLDEPIGPNCRYLLNPTGRTNRSELSLYLESHWTNQS